MERVKDVVNISHACGRRLLRVGAAGDDQIELIFERRGDENGDLLVTLEVGTVWIGGIDLAAIEEAFGQKYGLGVS